MDLKNRIIKELESVIDPELRVNIMDLGLIKDLNTDKEGSVSFVFRPSSKQCPIGIQLAIKIKERILAMDEVKDVHIDVQNFIHKDKLEEILSSIK